VDRRLEAWASEAVGARLWRRDSSLWSATPVPELEDRLGWLELPRTMLGEVAALRAFADQVRGAGLDRVALLGMGGSSLAPEVFQRSFGNADGFPELLVLDSTHPAAVAAAASVLDPRRTLFVVSSKSGGTLETMSLFRFFWDRCQGRTEDPGQHFVAITDPGSSLEALARERGLRQVFPGLPEVGGRYSALSLFGLLPAALIGVDLERLLASARDAMTACQQTSGNPGLELGAALGELALAGRDKLTFAVSPALAAFPDWLEQLIAESTGKDGRGIVPVVGEPLAEPERYGQDRVFFALSLPGEAVDDDRLGRLAAAGHPLLCVTLDDPYDLGAQIFLWEVAVAAASVVLGVHPFNQPDVQLAKEMAKRAMASSGVAASTRGPGATAADQARLLLELLGDARGGDYLAIQAFLARGPELDRALAELQGVVRDRSRLAVTVGYGPRFLHSTGQLHKGGPASVVSLQLVDSPALEVTVPETDATFNRLVAAQARGDADALRSRGRRVLQLDLGPDPLAALAALVDGLG